MENEMFEKGLKIRREVLGAEYVDNALKTADAAALNRADLLMLEGKHGSNSKINDLYGAGMELAGVVETSSPL